MMVPLLKTERLLLRPWRMEDAPAMFEVARDPQVGPNAGWAPLETLDEAQDVLTLWLQEEFPDWLWAITESGKDWPIGSIGLELDKLRPGVPGCRSMAYVLGTACWGKGYATEAAQAVLDYAFHWTDVQLISINHYPWNNGSRRVIEKCGFTYEGTLHRAKQLYDGRIVDELLYRMTRDEFLGNQK